MFIIQDRHYEAISKNAEDEFTAKTIVFLKENQPEWCQTKADQDICDYIKTVIEFARSFSIDEALAIQKLAFYKIELGFSLPPESQYHCSRLGRAEFDDSYRVDQFVADFESGLDYVLIDQGTDSSRKHSEKSHAPNP